MTRHGLCFLAALFAITVAGCTKRTTPKPSVRIDSAAVQQAGNQAAADLIASSDQQPMSVPLQYRVAEAPEPEASFDELLQEAIRAEAERREALKVPTDTALPGDNSPLDVAQPLDDVPPLVISEEADPTAAPPAVADVVPEIPSLGGPTDSPSSEPVEEEQPAVKAAEPSGPSAAELAAAESEYQEILAGLKSADPTVRIANISKMLELASQREDALVAIVEMLGDEDKNVIAAARANLSSLGSLSVPALVSALEHDNQAIRKSAVDALRGFDAEAAADAFEPLATVLATGSDEVRAAAAIALGSVGFPPERAVPALIDSLGDKNQIVRENAARALGSFGAAATSAVEALKDLQSTDTYWARAAAKDALRRIAPAPRKQTAWDR